MKSVCVYCGSSSGKGEGYLSAADALGAALAAQDLTLVYGGASIGVMGRIADRVMSAGGQVIGVIPKALADLEIAHAGLTELIMVEDMHERKSAMAEAADGFIALPGGLGTLEELFEVWTWSQLGIHKKPVGVLNAMGFYDRLLEFLDWQTDQGFIKQPHRDLLQSDADPQKLIEKLMQWEPLKVNKLL